MWKKINPWSVALAVILAVFWGVIGVSLYKALAAKAEGPGYNDAVQTENETVIDLTNQVAEIYPICPEVLQALIFYESSNQRDQVSKWGDIGYMQVNPKWHTDRMDKLGVTDLTDGYGNILVGTDYLYELCLEYGDIATALMVYNQGPGAASQAQEGKISTYARNILQLSEELERLHGK